MPKISRGQFIAWLVFAVIIIALDQGSKIYIERLLVPGESMKLLPFLNATLTYNKGAAFSFLADAGGYQHYIFGGIAVVISLLIMYWLRTLPPRAVLSRISLSLILGGAMGNLLDRIIRGQVVDFIDFYIGNWHFANFNIADSAITIGALMLIIEALSKTHKPGQG